MTRRLPTPSALLCLLLCLTVVGLAGGCREGDGKAGTAALVVYTSVDEPVARPILKEFTRQTGIEVVIQTDTERNKSAGLATRLEAERDNPQADVWWGNEVFHTINLAEAGLLAPYESPAAADIPPLFKDAGGLWAGTALRARVMALADGGDAERVAAVRNIRSIEQLTDPKLRGRIAMAHPAAGTTTGHMAALYVLWGEDRARRFLRDLRANEVHLLGGNSVVAEKVGQGTIWAGLTDNDDVDAATAQGGRLRMVLPDQGNAEIGTLTIPCTVALVKGTADADNAKKLIDYLLSPEVERRLIEAKFARYSVRGGQAAGADAVRPMDVKYADVAKVLGQAAHEATDILEGRGRTQ